MQFLAMKKLPGPSLKGAFPLKAAGKMADHSQALSPEVYFVKSPPSTNKHPINWLKLH